MVGNANAMVDYSVGQINSLVFKYEYRVSPENFSRSSDLGFVNTMLLILNLVKKSAKAELMNFFSQLNADVEVPSRQAFSEAREKISYRAFKDLFDKSCELAVLNGNERLYKGYRLFAVDGTSFFVGSMDKLSSYFGTSTCHEGRAMCRISAVVDVRNDCIVHAAVAGFETGERALAVSQVKALSNVPHALYIFDRGYWSPELVKGIIQNGQKFLMRLAKSAGKAVVLDDKGEQCSLRRYSFVLPNGEEEILLTNLTEDELADDELAALYAKRWGAETKYLELKDRLQIDKFSGCSVNTVLQDIYATLYFSNLIAFICYEADVAIKTRNAGKSNKYEQKTNRTTCISTLRQRFIKICLMPNPTERDAALRRFFNDVSKDVIYVGKSKPRPRDKRRIKAARMVGMKCIL